MMNSLGKTILNPSLIIIPSGCIMSRSFHHQHSKAMLTKRIALWSSENNLLREGQDLCLAFLSVNVQELLSLSRSLRINLTKESPEWIVFRTERCWSQSNSTSWFYRWKKHGSERSAICSKSHMLLMVELISWLTVPNSLVCFVLTSGTWGLMKQLEDKWF